MNALIRRAVSDMEAIVKQIEAIVKQIENAEAAFEPGPEEWQHTIDADAAVDIGWARVVAQNFIDDVRAG